MRKQTLRILSSALITICLGVIPAARAVDPPPDGGYPNAITAEGDEALIANTSGDHHTAIGYHALQNVLGDFGATAAGSMAISNSTTLTPGVTAIGFLALQNSNGADNVAIGANALKTTDVSDASVAVGANTLSADSKVNNNVAFGSGALQNAVDPGGCAAFGYNAMGATDGDPQDCVAVGSFALLNTNGHDNIALGAKALMNLTDSSDENIAIGYGAGRRLLKASNNNIDIGNPGVNRDNGIIRIGIAKTHKATFVAGISGVTVSSGVQVVINNKGQLGILTSSARHKKAIRPMGNSSEVIYSLHPVTYRYKKTLDSADIPQFGLVAEQVAKVAPELVAYDKEGKPYSVRYQAVNAMLLNEFQKDEQTAAAEDGAVKIQQTALDRLDAKVARLEAELAD